MKIITWNCNMAFRKKAEFVMAYQPDILIVQECEHPDKLIFKKELQKPTGMLWFGENQHKGLGIFSYSGFQFSVMGNYNPAFKLVIPILVTGPKQQFVLFAIWANNPIDTDGPYIEQVWKAIHYYSSQLTHRQTILAGDFNSNTVWDRKHRAANHSNVVKVLEEKGIFSCYHTKHKQVQGKENHPTHYLYRHRDKPYHLDYCFVSDDLLQTLQSFEVGGYDYWTQHSDHVPLIATFDF